jgi:hypothetical protein
MDLTADGGTDCGGKRVSDWTEGMQATSPRLRGRLFTGRVTYILTSRGGVLGAGPLW